jgi:hypothetical protein
MECFQRVALSTAANMCRKLPSDASDFVMEAVPLLTNLLNYHDSKVQLPFQMLISSMIPFMFQMLIFRFAYSRYWSMLLSALPVLRNLFHHFQKNWMSCAVMDWLHKLLA